jgi:hypothetical protein
VFGALERSTLRWRHWVHVVQDSMVRAAQNARTIDNYGSSRFIPLWLIEVADCAASISKGRGKGVDSPVGFFCQGEGRGL